MCRRVLQRPLRSWSEYTIRGNGRISATYCRLGANNLIQPQHKHQAWGLMALTCRLRLNTFVCAVHKVQGFAGCSFIVMAWSRVCLRLNWFKYTTYSTVCGRFLSESRVMPTGLLGRRHAHMWETGSCERLVSDDSEPLEGKKGRSQKAKNWCFSQDDVQNSYSCLC